MSLESQRGTEGLTGQARPDGLACAPPPPSGALRPTVVEHEITIEFLRLVNASTDTRDLIKAVTSFFQQQSGCSAVGVRLQDGEDYPYYEARGFPPEFVQAESRLCIRDPAGELARDREENPVLACMCGNVIRGRFDPTQPFFTARGSFWTNSTTQLLASTTEADRLARTRNRCNGEGYETVALIPLRFGPQRLGLLQLNDRRAGLFSLETIQLWERLADQLAVALAKFRADDALRVSEARFRSLFENMQEGFAFCRMLFDQGQPRDFIYLAVNRAFEGLTGLKGVVGRKVSEVIPGIREADPTIFETYGRVASTGRPEKIEIYVQSLRMWFSISAYCPAPEHFVAVFEVITERKQTEAALQESEMRFRTLFELAPDGIFLCDFQGNFVAVNRVAEELAGYARRELIGQSFLSINLLSKPDIPNALAALARSAKGEPTPLREYVLVRKDGRQVPVEIRTFPVKLRDQGLMLGVARDISERHQLEEQLRQAQKMEGIGQLAGGVAHDFNNLLAVMRGNAELLLMAPDQHSATTRECLKQITAASERAANLTRQLLAFSRKQVMQSRPLILNDVVADLTKMLRRIIGEHIDLQCRYAPRLPFVKADPGMIEQVLVNLAVNARDAMPRGGRLLITTEAVRFAEGQGGMHPEARAGEFVCLAVHDAGTGIAPEHLPHIFEPFFTTKEVGKGTGLGLATVYGVVRQHQGWIEVFSQPGAGTTFKIFLPTIPAPADVAIKPPTEADLPRGCESILLVEDDFAVRVVTRRALESHGYTVYEASSSREARALWQLGARAIELLLSDIVMPDGITGQDLAEQLQAEQPTLKVILMSGYSADVAGKDTEFFRHGGSYYLQKPIPVHTLLETVRRCLDEKLS